MPYKIPRLLEYTGKHPSFVVWRNTSISGVIVKSNNTRFPVGEFYYNYDKFETENWKDYDGDVLLTNVEGE